MLEFDPDAWGSASAWDDWDAVSDPIPIVTRLDTLSANFEGVTLEDGVPVFVNSGNEKTIEYYIDNRIYETERGRVLVAPCGVGKTKKAPGLIMEKFGFKKALILSERISAAEGAFDFYKKFPLKGVKRIEMRAGGKSKFKDFPSGDRILRMMTTNAFVDGGCKSGSDELVLLDEAHNVTTGTASVMLSVPKDRLLRMTATPTEPGLKVDLTTPYPSKVHFECSVDEMDAYTWLEEHPGSRILIIVPTMRKSNQVAKYMSNWRVIEVSGEGVFSGRTHAPLDKLLDFIPRCDVIVATDVLQESVTLDIDAVFDFGLRIRPYKDLFPTLLEAESIKDIDQEPDRLLVPVSRADAAQAAGRVGRLPGKKVQEAFICVPYELLSYNLLENDGRGNILDNSEVRFINAKKLARFNREYACLNHSDPEQVRLASRLRLLFPLPSKILEDSGRWAQACKDLFESAVVSEVQLVEVPKVLEIAMEVQTKPLKANLPTTFNPTVHKVEVVKPTPRRTRRHHQHSSKIIHPDSILSNQTSKLSYGFFPVKKEAKQKKRGGVRRKLLNQDGTCYKFLFPFGKRVEAVKVLGSHPELYRVVRLLKEWKINLDTRPQQLWYTHAYHANVVKNENADLRSQLSYAKIDGVWVGGEDVPEWIEAAALGVPTSLEPTPRRVGAGGLCWQVLNMDDVGDNDDWMWETWAYRTVDQILEGMELVNPTNTFQYIKYSVQPDGDLHIEETQYNMEELGMDTTGFLGQLDFMEMLRANRYAGEFVGAPFNDATKALRGLQSIEAVEGITCNQVTKAAGIIKRICPHAIPKVNQRFADEMHIPYDADSALSHKHAIHAAVRRMMLENLQGWLDIDWTLVSSKPSNLEYIQSHVPHEGRGTLQNFLRTPMDIGRYGNTVSHNVFTPTKFSTPTVVFHESGHYFTPEGVLSVFERNPNVATLILIHEVPLCAMMSSCSPKPSLWQHEVKDGKLFYIPEGDYDNAYEQPYDFSVIMAKTISNAKTTVWCDVVHTLLNTHMQIITRFPLEGKTMQPVKMWDTVELPPVHRDRYKIDPVPTQLFTAMLDYVQAVPKVTEQELFAKMRQELRTDDFRMTFQMKQVLVATVMTLAGHAHVMRENDDKFYDSFMSKLKYNTLGRLKKCNDKFFTRSYVREWMERSDFGQQIILVPKLDLRAVPKHPFHRLDQNPGHDSLYDFRVVVPPGDWGSWWETWKRGFHKWRDVKKTQFQMELADLDVDGLGIDLQMMWPRPTPGKPVSAGKTDAYAKLYRKIYKVKTEEPKEPRVIPEPPTLKLSKKVKFDLPDNNDDWADNLSPEAQELWRVEEEPAKPPDPDGLSVKSETMSLFTYTYRDMLVSPMPSSDEESTDDEAVLLNTDVVSFTATDESDEEPEAERPVNLVELFRDEQVPEVIAASEVEEVVADDDSMYATQEETDRVLQQEEEDKNVALVAQEVYHDPNAIADQMSIASDPADDTADQVAKIFTKRLFDITRFNWTGTPKHFWDTKYPISAEWRWNEVPAWPLKPGEFTYPEEDCLIESFSRMMGLLGRKAASKTTIWLIACQLMPAKEISTLDKGCTTILADVLAVHFGLNLTLMDEKEVILRLGTRNGCKLILDYNPRKQHFSFPKQRVPLAISYEPSDVDTWDTPQLKGVLKKLEEETVVRWKEFRPNYERASRYLASLIDKSTGTFKDNPENLDKLKGWEKWIKRRSESGEENISVATCTVLGDPGCGKTKPILDLFQRPTHENMTVQTVIPTTIQRDDCAKKMGVRAKFGPSGKGSNSGVVCTLEYALAKTTGGVVTLFDEDKFPPGYLDLYFLLKPRVRYAIFTCDLFQGIWHDPNKDCILNNDPSNAQIMLPTADFYIVGSGRPYPNVGTFLCTPVQYTSPHGGMFFGRIRPSCWRDLMPLLGVGAKVAREMWEDHEMLTASNAQVMSQDAMNDANNMTMNSSQGLTCKLTIIDVTKTLFNVGLSVFWVGLTRSQTILIIWNDANDNFMKERTSQDKLWSTLWQVSARTSPGRRAEFKPDERFDFKSRMGGIPSSLKKVLNTHPDNYKNWEEVKMYHKDAIGYLDKGKLVLWGGAKFYRQLDPDDEGHGGDPRIRMRQLGYRVLRQHDVKPPSGFVRGVKLRTALPRSTRSVVHEYINSGSLPKLQLERWVEHYGYTDQVKDEFIARRDRADILANPKKFYEGSTFKLTERQIRQKLLNLPKGESPLWVKDPRTTWGKFQSPKDDASYRLMLQERIQRSDVDKNRLEYEREKAYGVELWEALKKFLCLPERVAFDREMYERCIANAEAKRAARSTAMKKGSAKRGEPGYVQVSGKTQIKLKAREEPAKEVKALQTIVTFEDDILYGLAGMDYAQDKFLSLVPESVYFHFGKTSKDLQEYVAKYCLTEEYWESDLTQQEKGMTGAYAHLMVLLLEYLQLPASDIEKFNKMQIETHVGKIVLALATLSGQKLTSFKNTIGDTARVALWYDLKPAEPSLWVGDDSLVPRLLARVPVSQNALLYEKAQEKVIERKGYGTFISHIIKKGKVYKDPVLLLMKLEVNVAIGKLKDVFHGYFMDWLVLYENSEANLELFDDLEMQCFNILSSLMFNARKQLGIDKSFGFDKIIRADHGSQVVYDFLQASKGTLVTVATEDVEATAADIDFEAFEES